MRTWKVTQLLGNMNNSIGFSFQSSYISCIYYSADVYVEINNVELWELYPLQQHIFRGFNKPGFLNKF